MNIVIVKQSFFTFRGKPSYEIDLLGKTVLEHMTQRLHLPVCEEGAVPADALALPTAYPFLSSEELSSFAGTRGNADKLPSDGLISLADLPRTLARAAKESSGFHLAKGALVEEGAEVSFTAELNEGAVVRKGARLVGRCRIGKNAEIGSGCELTDSEVGEGTRVRSSVMEKAKVGADCTVGPNAYLRPDTVVGDGCRIGDFVELKNATIGRGCKISHLAYVGDADVGEGVNVGCGVVFVNYNGKKKFRTVVGKGCFLGSNCNLIAPLVLGDGVFVAAGSTVTRDLAASDFCIARPRETVKPGRADRYLK